MRTLTDTLLAAQKVSPEHVDFRLTFSKTGEDDVVIEQHDEIGPIIFPSGLETPDSQTAQVVFDNSDSYFTALDLKGWSVVIERGLRASGTEYDAMPPMKVIDQILSSYPGVLTCTMSFEGIPNRIAKDKASKTYRNHWSNTKTVKDLITEVLSGVAVDTELTEEQTTSDSFINLYGPDIHEVAGQRLSMPNRTVTKISFKLKKVGSPGGNVTFKLSNASGGSILATKTIATSDIPLTTAAWKELTLTTPILIDKPITYDADKLPVGGAWITCEYTGGDVSNYVCVAVNSIALKANEWLVDSSLDGAAVSPDDTWEDSDRDLAYRYKYTAGSGTGVTHGIDCFTHCIAYDAVFDSEDSLIDTYLPADGFNIPEGSIRHETINTLLRFTNCVGIWKADGKFHVFAPTISGTTYDYQYAFGSGNHEFFAKSIRNALVSPNKITVHSYDSNGVLEYSGSATDASWQSDNHDGNNSEIFPPVKCSSGAQAASIAAAMLAQVVMNAQQGSATAPINLGAEIYDYCLVTDTRENDTRTGNLGRIRWWWRPGKEFNMTFSFGERVSAPLSAPTPYRAPRWEHPSEIQLAIEQYSADREKFDTDVATDIKDIKTKLDLPNAESTSDQIDTALVTYLKSLFDDKNPKLGANLDPNGKYINGDLVTITDGAGNIGDATHYWLAIRAVKHYIGEIYNFITNSTNDMRFCTPNTAHADFVLAMHIAHGDTPYLDMDSHKIRTVLDPTTDQDAATKIYVDQKGSKVGLVASTAIAYSNDTTRSTSSTDYIKLKEIKLKQPVAGSIRVYCELANGGSAYGAAYKLYVNGVWVTDPSGHVHTDATFEPFYDDISGPFVYDDLIQIYGMIGNVADICYVKNMRLAFDISVDAANQDP